MRGFTTWAFMALVAVLLQGAAKVSEIQDIGMGSSMKERLVSVPTSVTSIATVPEGLVYGPVSRKGNRLVYRVLLGPADYTAVTAIIGGKTAKKTVGNYPAQPAQVVAKIKSTRSSSGGSQPSKQAYSPAPPAKPWLANSNLNGWELSGHLVQDTRGWFTDNSPGTMTQGNTSLRGTFQVARGVGVFGEVAGSLTQDRSANWETNARLGQNLAGFGGGLTALVLPRTTLSVGVRYFVDVPMGVGAVNSPNLFAEVKGNDGNQISYSAKLSSNAFKDIGGMGEVTAKIHPNWGVSVIGVAKHYTSGTNDAQVGVGSKWFPTASDSSSVGAYIMTPTTTTAPPAAAITFQWRL